ncbi:hypothetical protein AMATHDRAFT_137672 [Amanita thiersii Skay4041]|uniref:Telomere-associated protein Rif1 N-terminal domain-containing protein n=1 Tax=Amanita thiersii Skay4041 TaxID=703135 RepID=A0A2A9NZ58_9AGAR|nr:hypothetical protein AMATHDRAFT_137672 [Amanita thiersii Skay4041]
MSLPTPPGSSHSGNKENLRCTPTITRGVAWAQHHQIHTLSSPPPSLPRTPRSACRNKPSRSILKKPSYSNIPLPHDIFDEFKPRDATPEPEDPLVDLKYLENPIQCIISLSSSLKNLIEAYNVLSARLRSCVTGATDADASWPLFQPIRKNKHAFVRAIIRDLGRALVDPLVGECNDAMEKRILAPLPSPRSTPRKKRDGMTAEQVKYARDLCTISHSVLKLLGVILALPAIYCIFSNEELSEIFTEVLAIPLAPMLPTINARKTCAFAIWLVQVQRLPREVLAPAADRIAAALRRAIEGELGKEGKKGSVSDGLKAIHDLCEFQPSIFINAFAPILPSILQSLLAPTLALRLQACQALGSMVAAANQILVRNAHTHARFAWVVRSFLTQSPPNKKQTSTAVGNLTPREPTIIRTLRTTLEATDPHHSAQGPVWALNVLAQFITLLGPVLIEDQRLCRMISSLLGLGLRHPKSSVRALVCVVWRPLVWVWFQPPFKPDITMEEDWIDSSAMVNDDEEDSIKQARKRSILAGKETFWKLISTVVDCRTGVLTIAALLGNDSSKANADDTIKRVFHLLKLMIQKGGSSCADAIDIVQRLVSFEQLADPWDVNMLLPRSLFTASSNLLAVEFKNLSTTVRSILERSAGLDVVRSFTREEISRSWIFDGLVETWRTAVGYLQIFQGSDTPTDIAAVWNGLIKANVSYLQDENDDPGITTFTIRAADILIDIIQDRNIDLTAKMPSVSSVATGDNDGLSICLSSDPPQPDAEPNRKFSNGALKLRIMRDLWATVRLAVPHSMLLPASQKLLLCLVANEEELLSNGDILNMESGTDGPALSLWSQLCADLLMHCDVDTLKSFWGQGSGLDDLDFGGWNRSCSNSKLIWITFAAVWAQEAEWVPECFVVLLSIPFYEASSWDVFDNSNDQWESFLDLTINKALDHGSDAVTVVNDVATSLMQILNWRTAAEVPFVRATDSLLSRWTLDDSPELPIELLNLVNQVLLGNYPPMPDMKQYLRWLLRTLAKAIESCVTKDFAEVIVTTLRHSVSLWISDNNKEYSEDEWIYDLEPLYGYMLCTLQLLPKTVNILNDNACILASALLRNEFRTPLVADMFKDFWETCSNATDTNEKWCADIRRCLVGASVKNGYVQADLSQIKTPNQLEVLSPSFHHKCTSISSFSVLHYQ